MLPDSVADPTREAAAKRENAPDLPLAAILAGGASRRFGSPKALARVGGVALIERVRDALRFVVPDPVLITRDPQRYAFLGLPSREDRVPDGGPLAGLHAVLLWSRELERRGALVVACDLPFLHPQLLRRILHRASRTGVRAVAPEGPGRFGIEPLCAWYSAEALPEVEQRLASGDLSLGHLLLALGAERIPREDVGRLGAPEVLFHNVNTRADQAAAEQIARTKGKRDGPI